MNAVSRLLAAVADTADLDASLRRHGVDPDRLRARRQAGRVRTPRRAPSVTSGRRPARFSPAFRMVAATDRPVNGERLSMDRLAAPTGPVPLTWRHQMGAPIGTVTGLEVGSRRLIAVVKADLATERGRALWRARQSGRVCGSVGYTVPSGDGSWSLLDVAWVDRPADPGAVTSPWLL